MDYLIRISGMILPMVIVGVVAVGLWKKQDVYTLFIKGAEDGMRTVAGITDPGGTYGGRGNSSSVRFFGFFGGSHRAFRENNLSSGRSGAVFIGKDVFIVSGNGACS